MRYSQLPTLLQLMNTLPASFKLLGDDSSLSALAENLRATASSAEVERDLAADTVDQLRGAKLFQLWRPTQLGGLELSVREGLEIIEELARHDSSAAWNVQISSAVDLFGAWFPDDRAKQVFSGANILSGALNPPFSAEPANRDGVEGFTVTGRAAFASGVSHADFIVMLTLSDGGAPHLTMVPRADLTIDRDSWRTLGMRATGSSHIEANGVFVRKSDIVPLAPRQSSGSAYGGQLYRMTIWPLVSALAAPALGVARACIDDFLELASFKTPFYTNTTLCNREVTQSQIARAEATLGAARAYFYAAIDAGWAEVESPGSWLSMKTKQTIQLATCHAVEQAAEVVNLTYSLAGSSGFRQGKDPRSDMTLRFERHLRDIYTMKQHAFISTSRFESVGKLMLGLETDWPFFPF